MCLKPDGVPVGIPGLRTFNIYRTFAIEVKALTEMEALDLVADVDLINWEFVREEAAEVVDGEEVSP
jgi:hypothetical protein